MKKVLILVLLLLLGAGFYIYPSLSSTLNIATGFTAKNICSGYFISGFNPLSIAKEALQPIDDAFKHVSFDVDKSNKAVTADIIGLFERRAIYRDGLGCTLLAVGQDALNTEITPLEFTKPSTHEPWPLGLAAIEQADKAIDYKRLDEAINNAFSEPELSGKRHVKAVAIIHKGQLIAERYAEGVTMNTPLLSWSMAKSITALQVGILAKTGKLDLAAPANVPLWQSNNDPRAEITLDQLMRMSSGLKFNETYGINTDVSQMLSIERDAGSFAADKPLEFSPDNHWSYSSGTTNIISAIIKRSIDGSFQDYYEHLQQQLLHPLGIFSGIQETDGGDTFIGSSYFYATARDWAKLGQLMLQNGNWDGKQLLPIDWTQYSITPTKTTRLNQYGAQFWLNRDPDSNETKRKWPSVPEDVYYMGGYQGQYVVVVPSKQLVIVRFGFTSPGTNRGVEQLISDTIDVLSQ